MTYRIVLSTAALKELDDSYDWYEEKSFGLGPRFILAVNDALNRISLNPEAFPKKNDDYREILTKVFPYLIVYEIKYVNIINVIHIFHTHRNPKFKLR